MQSDIFAQACRDYDRIEKAIKFIEAHFDRQPELKEIAGHVGLSEFHFQRLFSRWVGISPKRFLQFLTKEYAKACLHRQVTLLDACVKKFPVADSDDFITGRCPVNFQVHRSVLWERRVLKR